MNTITKLSFVVGASVLVACGPSTPAPKTGADLAKEKAAKESGEASIQAMMPPKAKREVSGAAAQDFATAVKRYREARQRGLSKGDCASVAEAFGSIYAGNTKLVEAKFNEGAVWHECGDLAKAEQIYQGILNQHAGYGPALNNLGQIYLGRGSEPQALSYFEKAAGQKNSEGYANLALVQRNRALQGDSGSLKDGVNNIHRSLAVDSHNIEAYATLALLLYDHAKSPAQLEMARLICLQAARVDPKYSPIYNILGLVLLKSGRVTPALVEFRRAVSIDPNFKEALMNIGAVTLSFRDYKSAEQAFAKVLSLSPAKSTQIAATIGLGVALRGQRKFADAMARYQEVQKLDPSNLDISYNMGLIVQDYTFDASNPAKGIAALQQAEGHFNRYIAGGQNQGKVEDARRRIKNINEMIPMLREQEKMGAQPAAEPAKAKAGAK
ncbi:MAG: tetratricopeptide repeat protein [Deltaproteobacteria bacterium]|nr:tetratricopeptide repeat protein [Deltaproteobacteria bacterium]